MAWGRCAGQLGLGDRFTRELPVPVPGLAGHKIVGVAAGQQHSAAVSDTGRLFTWGGGTCGIGHGDGAVWSCGWGVDGVLGHGDKKYRAVPAPIRALEGEAIAAAAAGWRHNLIIKVRHERVTLRGEARPS